MISWWIIILAIIIVVIVTLIVRGMLLAYRCRHISAKEEEKIPKPELEIDEDSEAGDSGNS